MSTPFLDTNVVLRHLLADHPDHSPRSTELLRRLEQGEVRVRTSELVVFECVLTLERYYHVAKNAIRDALLPLVELPGKRPWRVAFDLYVLHRLPFADAYHAALMQQIGLPDIISLDHDFDRLPGIRRQGP
ncbi:MAG: PIN domain-containing protein [Anaerolineae bacterium]